MAEDKKINEVPTEETTATEDKPVNEKQTDNEPAKAKSRGLIGLLLIVLGVFAGIIVVVYLLVKPEANFQPKDDLEELKNRETYYKGPKPKVRIQGRVRGSHAFSEKEKKLYLQYLDKAEEYQKQGDRAKSFGEKEKLYLLAIKQLDKMKKKRPKLIGSKRWIIQQITESLTKLSTLRINLGDTRKALIKALGKPEKEIDSIKFMPVGSVKELFFLDRTVMVSLYDDEVFAIDIKSDFQGTFKGIRIGDSLEKIKALYTGRRIEIEGNNFGYECEQQPMKFQFVDADENVDAIKQLNKSVYEELTSKFSD